MICITEVNQLELHVRVELDAGHKLDRDAYQAFTPGHKVRDIADDHVLKVCHSKERLRNGGGIDIDLNRRLPPGQNVRLELWRDLKDEYKPLQLHRQSRFQLQRSLRQAGTWGE